MKKLFLLATLMLATLILSAQPTGSKGGKFTVASGVQVRFSQGNLQYHVRNHVWQFAVRQDSVIGKTNENRIEENYNGWIDLFGWGTSGYNDKMPYMYVRDNAAYGNGAMDIAGTNYDWGVYNAISNGGNKAGLWRTLTSAEWLYLLNNRQNAKLLHGFCSVNGLRGHIILPDNWSLPSGAHFTPTYADRAQNTYSLEEWTIMENAGAIFLPEAGYAYSNNSGIVTWSGPTSASNRGNIGPMTSDYITSTAKSSTSYCGVCLDGPSSFYNQDNNISTKPTSNDFYRENPVRLARTVEEYTVTFKDWDGTMLKTENIEYGFAATPPTDLVREGWTFTGWTASVSGMQTNYITGEVTFTAQYEKYITYTVTFVDGLTNDVIFVLTKAKGTALETSEYPAVPTHEGNAFQGWFLTNGTAPISTSLTVNSNLTLTARFTWDATAGVLKGVMAPEGSKFSIRANKQVVFSQGNLQYQPSTNTWRFAADQYTVLTQAENKKFSDPTYTGWVDVFTWSAEGAEYGLTTSVGYPASIGTFVDWGQNPIANGGNKANSWRTLSKEEWEYIFSGRPNATQLMFTVYLTDRNSLWGKVILPDDWMDSPVCVSLLSDINYSGNNGLDDDDWSSFEAYGALFLPYTTLCGIYGGEDYWLDDNFHYWTKSYNSEFSSVLGADLAYDVQTSNSTVLQVNSSQCNQKEAVRLARYDQDCSEIASEFSVEAIGCYTWEGKTYVSSGDYRRLYSTANGCDSVVTLHLTIEQEQPVGGSGALQGLFSISADTQVRFSCGNLQYQEDTHTWRFAPEQMDVIGPTAIAGGWRGAFGWSSTNSQFGLGTDFSGNFVDWGENAIANGGNRANRWRALTGDEWYYLLQARPNAANLRYSGKIEGRFGTIILPDDWTAPVGVTLVKSQTNEFTRVQWTVLENAGAVFLPSGGLTVPSYWSASASNDTHAYDIDYNPNGSNAAYQRSNTYHVRLVQEPAKPIEGTLEGKFSVSADKQVRFSQGNLQYKASTDTWQFANTQTEYIGEGNANTSPTYDGWIDLFGWGTGDRPTLTSPYAKTDYKEFVDWGENAISNGGNKPNVWRTLSKSEWFYLLQYRTNANQLFGPATVNGVHGLILLPDDWESPSGISFTPKSSTTTWEANIYSSAQWTKMVENGAVFLPANGEAQRSTDGAHLGETTVEQVESAGYYWTPGSGADNWSHYADGLNFAARDDYKYYSSVFASKSTAFGVRLVRDFVPGEDCTPVYASFTETACDSYTWNGVKYTVSGNYEQTFVTEQGCDSIVTLFLTINKSYNIGFGEEAEESYTWQGTTYTESGDYTKTLQSVNGCDSVVTLHLTIGEIVTPCTDKTSEFSASAETSYTWEGTTYTESGDYVQTFPMAGGCDSVVTLHLTIGGEELIYDLRICGTRVTSTNCSDLSVLDGVTGAVAYDPATNTLTLENATLTTPDVTQAIWNQIPELKIIVKGACDLNTPYCIALRIDANTTIEGFDANASLKVRNAGPLDHAIGSVAAGTCYTALATFNNANLIVKDCFVEAEGAGGILLQGSSQLTVNHARLTALSIGTPTSDAQWNVMRSFKASVAPVLIDCELLAPEGVTFSTTLGGYTTDGSTLTREKVIIGNPEPEQKWTNGILPGKFSVSADKQVQFSQGNLQYQASTETWQFAENQNDYIGDANVNISSTYDGWIDLFGWGTGNNPTLATQNNADYAVFTDWGVNAISNGGNQANLWRTLTADEWEYLFRGRTNAEQLFSTGEVDGVFGCIILPDDWTAPEGITFNSIITSASWNEENGKYTDPGVCVLDYYNNFSVSEWKQMEEAGAVFLAAAGVRNGAKIEAKNKYGKYWAAPAGEETIAKSILIDICGFSVRFSEDSYWGSRSIGGPVRLVQEISTPCTDKTSEFSETAETSYEWNGTTYTESGDYTQTFPMANGCDSIVTLHLTITGGSATYLTVAQAMDEYTNLALENKATSENSYTVRGYVTQWVSGYPDYQNADFFIDDTEYGSNTLLECYRLTADNEADKRTLIVGDYVEATAYLKNYNGRAELVNGTFRVITAATPVEDRGDISVADFLAAADTKNIYHLTGVVSDLPEDRTSNAWKYGNFNLTDATGTVYIYGLLTADSVAQQFLSLDIENEDEVTLKGVYSLHNGNPQIANAIFISRKKHSHEGVENVGATEEATKILLDGQVYILRNGRIYTILGAEVR